MAELYTLHCFESDTELLEFVDSLLADNKYHFPLAECMEGGVHSANPTQSESRAANEWPTSRLLPCGSDPSVNLDQISSSGEQLW